MFIATGFSHIAADLAKAVQKHLLIRRLKATAIDVVALAICSIELPTVQVSATTGVDSSNLMATQSSTLF